MTAGTMLRLTPQHKLAAIAAAALVMISFAAWGFGRAVAGVRQGEAARRIVQEKITDAAEQRRQARISGALLQQRNKDLARIARFFVNRKNPIAFIEAVERAGAETYSDTHLDIDEGRSSEWTLRFRFTVQGAKDDLLRFVRVLELLPYSIDMQEMVFQDIVPDGSGGSREQGLAARGGAARLLLSLDVGAR